MAPPGRSSHPLLPPSVEKAYSRKCIQLKRRIKEVEESNDQARNRKIRLDRSILKLRLERAFLLEQLAKRMDYNVDESDRSTSPPPTPHEKPLRSKRSHRKTGTPPPPQPLTSGSQQSPPAAATQPVLHPLSSAQSTPDIPRTGSLFFNAVNGTHNLAPGQSHHSLPPPLPRFNPITSSYSNNSSNEYDEQRRGSHPQIQENGGSEHATPRPFASSSSTGGGATSDLTSGPEARADANGERRGAPDTEMQEAQQAAQPAPGFSGGFTAVNR